MKLADPIIIKLANEEVELHPSLGHAMQLERRPGSFKRLMQEITEGSLTAALDVIGPHADWLPFLKNRVYDELPRLTPHLLAYVIRCTGIDPDQPATKGNSAGKPIPFDEHLLSLYRIGTGWLGWTPADTLDSTPAEIIEANKGRMDMLKALFGGGEKPKDNRPVAEKMRGIFARIGTQKEEA